MLHANSTSFTVKDTLCVVGDCDDKYEPFCEIYQFDQWTKEWNECGVSSVSCYRASVVALKLKRSCLYSRRFQEKGCFMQYNGSVNNA